jgi:hypothetical protein
MDRGANLMATDDRYENWKQRRANVAVPADFADRVMKGIEDIERGREPAPAGWLLAFLWSWPGRIAVGVLAALVCAIRIAAVGAVFLFPR